MLSSLRAYLNSSAMWPLIVKETQQLLRNKQLVFMILFPPTFQLWLFCSSLDPQPKNVRVAVHDSSATPASRDLTALIFHTNVFIADKGVRTENDALEKVKIGTADAAVIIPPKFSTHIDANERSPVQVVIDGVDANTSGIVAAYFNQMFAVFNRTLNGHQSAQYLSPQISFLYNPGLRAPWFFVPGLAAILITMLGLLLSASCFVREKDTGTLDQLLMTPADSFQIIVAKLFPNLVALAVNGCLAVATGMLIFQVPFRGNLLLMGVVAFAYSFVTVAIGMAAATFSRNQTQAILTAFFASIPIVQVSGTITPMEDAPAILQKIAWFNPLFHFDKCLKAVILRGAGFDVIWLNVLMIILWAVVLMAVSSHYFRRQLG